MNIVDIICIIVIALWLLVGFKKGGLFGVLQLAATVVSFILAYIVHPYVRNALSGFLNYSSNVDTSVFVILFLVLSLLVNAVAGKIINTLGSSDSPGKLNRAIGAIFGAAQGAVYVSALLVLFSAALGHDSTIKRQIDNGIVSTNVQKGVTEAYGKINRLIRKNDINPLRDVERIIN